MGTFLAGLVSIAGTVAGRVLLSLGFSVVTITGVAEVVSSFKADIVARLAVTDTSILMLVGHFGAWDALGILFGAATFCVSYWAATSSVRILGVGGPGG